MFCGIHIVQSSKNSVFLIIMLRFEQGHQHHQYRIEAVVFLPASMFFTLPQKSLMTYSKAVL
jgi:hypothetical protein